MAKYKKKPVEIEAVQFIDTVKRMHEIVNFMQENPVRFNYEDPKNPYILITTLEGVMRADVNDYIIKGIKGEFYPCKPDIFEASYELIAE